MISEKSTTIAPQPTHKWLPWVNLLLALLLIGLGIWYLADKVNLAEIGEAMAAAKVSYIIVAVAIFLLTTVLKAWRWQTMLIKPDDTPTLTASFWATSLGQYVNVIVPFFRLGEVARIYALNQQSGTSMARALGTLVVEKTLDLIFFAITIFIVLPFVILPEFLGNPSFFLAVVSIAVLLMLYLFAYQTERLTLIMQHIANKMPQRFGARFIRLFISGLEGLGALRSRRLMLLLLLQTIIIALLSVVMPYLLFFAFDLPLGIVAATLVHIAATIAAVPPSTPAKIGVINGAVAFTLFTLDIDAEAAIISYAIVFHLVLVLPQIVLGLIATGRTNWHWQKTVKQANV